MEKVILTSDKAPVDMQDIEQRLLSRFKWGLSAELHQPDYETRISILKKYLCIVMVLEEIIEYVGISNRMLENLKEL
jgi:chromosomal replication initiator protein